MMNKNLQKFTYFCTEFLFFIISYRDFFVRYVTLSGITFKRTPCEFALIHRHFPHFSHEGYSDTLAHSRSARSKFLRQTPTTPLIRQG